jgi:hypothetical protein
MAKHLVKCPGCGKIFDANTAEYVLINRRYWHKGCYEENEASKTQEEKDLEALFTYCKNLFGRNYNYMATKRLIEKYHTEYNYTYSGITRTLRYWYEIKNNPIDKSNGTIGIVPYAYDDAYRYWYSIWLANQHNDPKILEKYEPKVIEITIPIPERKERKRKLFTFLDKETEEDGK